MAAIFVRNAYSITLQAALACLVRIDDEARTNALDAYAERWDGNMLAMDKWRRYVLFLKILCKRSASRY